MSRASKRRPTKRREPTRAEEKQFKERFVTPRDPPPPTSAETLTARQSTHGDFSENARVMQGVKRLLRTGENWAHHAEQPPMVLSDVQAQAIEMIVVKLGRIVTGDPNHADSWLDIEGYARLARERLA